MLERSAALTWVVVGEGFDAAPQGRREWRNFTGRFAEVLRHTPRRGDDVVIAGTRPGQTLAGIVEELAQRVLRYRPEVVLVSLGLQDVQQPLRNLGAFERKLGHVIARLLEAGAIPVLCTPPATPVADADAAVDQYVHIEAIRALAAELDLPLVDHCAHWEQAARERGGLADWYDGGPAQPGRQGHAELTDRLIADLSLPVASVVE